MTDNLEPLDNQDDHDGCDPYRDNLAELALGILPGRERSALLEHLETCPQCATELEQLSNVADSVLLLAPEAEPPLGFELRLAQRLQDQANVQAPTARRWRRVGVLSAAAALVVVVGVGTRAVPYTHDNNTPPPVATATPNLTTAMLTSAQGHRVGEVFVSAGQPSWLFMTIDNGVTSGVVRCTVTLADGQVETIGAFRITKGYGAWGASLSSAAGDVRSAHVLSANGTVLASAQLTT
jgi:hypothetical protein